MGFKEERILRKAKFNKNSMLRKNPTTTTTDDDCKVMFK